jgi:hypothetical protein
MGVAFFEHRTRNAAFHSNTRRLTGATHGFIHSLYIELERLHEPRPKLKQALVIPPTRDGMPAGKGDKCRSRRKRRTIELRVGDQVLCLDRWRMIKSILAYQAN